MYEKSIEIEKKILERNSKGIKKSDVEWIRKKILKSYSDRNATGNDLEREYRVLFQLNQILYSIQADKPTNVRSYTEKIFNKRDYDGKLGQFSNEILSIKPGDVKACDELRDKIYALLDEAEKEFPGFRKDRAMMISELMGNLSALRTKGFMGSTAMLSHLKKKEKAKEKKKKI
jgi:hypothetical protein